MLEFSNHHQHNLQSEHTESQFRPAHLLIDQAVTQFSSPPHTRKVILTPRSLPSPEFQVQAGLMSASTHPSLVSISYLPQKQPQTPKGALGTSAQRTGTCGTVAGRSGAGPAAWSTGGRGRRSQRSGRDS